LEGVVWAYPVIVLIGFLFFFLIGKIIYNTLFDGDRKFYFSEVKKKLEETSDEEFLNLIKMRLIKSVIIIALTYLFFMLDSGRFITTDSGFKVLGLQRLVEKIGMLAVIGLLVYKQHDWALKTLIVVNIFVFIIILIKTGTHLFASWRVIPNVLLCILNVQSLRVLINNEELKYFMLKRFD